MKIKNKLYLSAGISIILAAVLASLSSVTSDRIAEANQKHDLANDVYKGVAELDIVTYDYLLHREERMYQQWHAKYDSIAETMNGTIEGEVIELNRADYATLGNLFSQVTENSQATQQLIQEGAKQEEIDAALAIEERLASQLLITSHSVITNAARLADEAEIEAAEAQRLAADLTLILVVALACAVTVSSLLVARSISRPLDELTKGAQIVGKGDLRHKVKVKTKDELGQLGAAFNKMIANLKKVTASRDELNKEVLERKRAEERLSEQAQQLELVNKELEAFSYSVSHDLRAPLRGIDGFSQILLEDYADKLDEQGKDHLQRVRRASQHMAQLIDDILGLSRITRSEMRRETVDLSSLTREIAAELKKTQPERQVEFVIDDGVLANGDSRLLGVVMQNLMNNAWKFTGKRKSARIEFGITQHGGRSTYFVRDDGVGFDMTYADKLFGAFQRLHSQDEFPGTGIGLATVQRIIHRHGGNIWAEGALEKGATFYFTLHE